jgi:hypothetical protein
MSKRFDALVVGQRFNHRGEYYLKVAEHTAMNLHSDFYSNFWPCEPVIVFGEN